MLDVAEFVQKLVTLFLGPSGRHIADIQNLSGAKIQVSKKVQRLTNVVSKKGTTVES